MQTGFLIPDTVALGFHVSERRRWWWGTGASTALTRDFLRRQAEHALSMRVRLGRPPEGR